MQASKGMGRIGASGAAVMACLALVGGSVTQAAFAQNGKPAREEIFLRVANDGTLTWNGAPLKCEELDAKLAEAEKLDPRPELHVIADLDPPRRTPTLGKVMQAVMAHGLMKIGFVAQ